MADKTIKQLQDELDKLILWFESEEVDLEKISEKYDKALGLVAQIEKQLQEAENKITKLDKKFG